MNRESGADALLCFGGPALGHRFTREMYDGVGVFERLGRRLVTGDGVSEVAAQQYNFVGFGFQLCNEMTAEEPASAGDGDTHV